MDAVKILVVEDDMIIAADLSMSLSQRGYEVTGIVPRGEIILDTLEADVPDLILMDVNLKGEWDGIETARHVQQAYDIPIIFLTANSDSETFERAKSLRPHAFLIKPYNQDDLERAIQLAMFRMEEGNPEAPAKIEKEDMEDGFILNDRIFVKSKDRLVKIALEEILYIQAESNYSKIVTLGKEYLMAITLKALEGRLKNPEFLRVHRSYIINLTKLDEVGEVYLKVGKNQIPISKSHRDKLYQRLNLI